MAEEGHRSPLNPGFLAGWLFFALAFVAAAAETSLGRLGLTSAHDLWHALDPGSLVIAKIRLDETLGPGTWDSVVRTVLAPPAWALFGVPAAVLIWLFRPHRASDVAEVEEAIKYYDMLVKAAREEGAVDDPPRWQELKEPDADERPDPVELGRDPIDHYMEQWVPPKPEEDAEALKRLRSENDLEEIGDHGSIDPGLDEQDDSPDAKTENEEEEKTT